LTEIPEHLLRRSRERREALGLSGGEQAPASSPAEEAPAAEAPAPAESAPTPAAAPTPVPAAQPEPPAPAPEPLPAYIQAAETRKKIPFWAVPVLILLPVWAWLYAATIDSEPAAAQGPLGEGEEVYAANCASCHLASGAGDAEGGVGRALNDGEVLLTFPDFESQVEYILQGSGPTGEPYGDPDRPGGPHIARGGMPGFEGVLSEEEIFAVVCYERVTIGGEEAPPECLGEGEGGGE
jgi:mono/diheme cytochrome c family protein